MTKIRVALVLLALAPLAGCGMADAQRQLDESNARLQATIMESVRTGHLTGAQAMDELDDMNAMEGAAMAPGPSYEAPAYVAQPVPAFHSGGGYEAPQPQAAPGVTFEPNYVSNPSRPGSQFVPYQAVAPLMPGIGPSGTAR